MHVGCQSLPQFLLHAVHYCYKVDCNYYNSQYQRITYLTNKLRNTNLIGLSLLIHLYSNYSNSWLRANMLRLLLSFRVSLALCLTKYNDFLSNGCNLYWKQNLSLVEIYRPLSAQHTNQARARR